LVLFTHVLCVSIPVWCDLEMKNGRKALKNWKFQFQYGAIWSVTGAHRNENFILFQFQYGAIWSKAVQHRSGWRIAFQFQYGAIWRNQLWVISENIGVFQFQYGAIWRMSQNG